MAEYERSRTIEAAPEDIFAFVSNVENLATFVPTVASVEQQAEEQVHVHGEVPRGAYDDAGWFHVEEGRRRIEWGAPDRNYSGWLSVAGDNGGTQVVVHLSAPPYVTESGRPISGEEPEEARRIEASLEAALDSLRNLMEGRGGKVEPATT